METSYCESPSAKVYVQVKVFFDPAGFMKPVELIWKDGKIFRIDQVIDMHESQAAYSSVRRDKYTVKICGQQCSLYVERTRLPHGMQVGRWYVERKILTPLKKTA